MILALYVILLLMMCTYLVYLIYRLWPVVRYAKQPLPFIPIPKHIAKAIAQLPELKDKKSIVDLGCGRGQLLSVIRKYHPSAHLFGVEYNHQLYAICHKLLHNKQPITLVEGDMFNYDVSDIDAIVGWWVPKFCDRLITKFVQECKPDCVIISYMFPLPAHPLFTQRIIKIKKDVIYVYETKP